MQEKNMWIVETNPEWDIFAAYGEYKTFPTHKEASRFYRYCLRKEGKENVTMKRVREIIRDPLPDFPVQDEDDIWDGEIDFPF